MYHVGRIALSIVCVSFLAHMSACLREETCRDYMDADYLQPCLAAEECASGICSEGRCLACPAGQRCLDGDCVLDDDFTCSSSTACSAGYVCSPIDHRCRQACETHFTSYECEGETYCAPLFDSESGEYNGTAACLPAQCRTNAECVHDQVCLKLDVEYGACFTACTYSFIHGRYQDDNPQGSCHPLGDDGPLIAMQSGERTVGEVCHQVSAPCAEGLVCISEPGADSFTCHQLCAIDIIDPAVAYGCADDEFCIERSAFSVCRK